MVTAVILAGGLGTRLAPIVPHLPKALAPIQDTPFLKLIFDQLERAGIVSKVVLALGYKADDIQLFLDYQSLPFPIEFSIESTPLGTGGALIHALPKVRDETVLVLNGDSYLDLSLLEFLNFHISKNADVTIACQRVDDISRYGSVEIDQFSQIKAYKEKRAVSEAGWISAGIYLIEKRCLEPFVPGLSSLEKDFFPLFLKRRLFAYCHEGTFIDIGTPSSYNEAQQILKPWIN